jgi:anti-sigma-K factor RskA
MPVAMSAPDRDEDIEGLAAEYALGTLEAAERAEVERRRADEPALDSALDAWARLLAPLADAVPEVTPPEPILARIEGRLDERAGREPGAGAQIIDLRQRVALWRNRAFLTGSLAAALLVGLGVRSILTPVGEPATPHAFVAMLQKDASSPAFVVTIDLDRRLLTARPVAAAAEPGKSYELWIIEASLGPPKSLGVIKPGGATRGPSLAAYEPSVITDALYAVTLEPEGGSPDGKPSGPPVFQGKLVATE